MKKIVAVLLSIAMVGTMAVQTPVHAAASDEPLVNDTVTSSDVLAEGGSEYQESVLGSGFSVSEEEIAFYGLRALADSNTCGESLTWTMEEGTLKISGTGAMADYAVKTVDGVTSCSAPWYSMADDIKTVVIDAGVTSIGACAFYNLPNLTSVTIPDTITTLGRAAFHKCVGLSEIILPSSVKTMADGAFSECVSLETIVCQGLESVGEYAFEKTALKTFEVPAGLSYIAGTAFLHCKMEAYAVEEGNTVYFAQDKVLYTKDGVLFAYPNGSTEALFLMPDDVTGIGDCAFAYNDSLTAVEIPNSVKTIGGSAFMACSKITKVVIPDGVTTVGAYAFSTCKALAEVAVGGDVSVIPKGAFVDCASLNKVTLSAGLQEVHKIAFKGCDSLAKVTLPESITFVHPLAFPETAEVTCLNTELENYAGTGYRQLQEVAIATEQYYDKAFEVLALVNTEREKEGLTPVKMDQGLMDAAMERAGEIALLFSHTRPDGTMCFTVNDLVQAENVAAGHVTANSVMYGAGETSDGWMDSVYHQENILSKKAKSIGVGCVYHNGIYYWVQCFGYEDAAGGTDCPKPANQTVEQKVYLALESFGDASNYVEDMYDVNPGKYQFKPVIDIDKSKDPEVAGVYVVNPGYSLISAKISDSSIQWQSDNARVANFKNATSGVITKGVSGTATIHAKMKYFDLSTAYVLGVQRLSGRSRYDTAFEIAETLRKTKNVETFDTVIIATGNNYADALSGSYLACVTGAPILLVDTARADIVEKVKTYIEDKVSPGATVYILGGTGAVGEEMEAGLEGYVVERLNGATRLETNLKILEEAQELGATSSEVLVCTAGSYADSLSASATGKPILLVYGNAMTAQQTAYLDSCKADNFYVIGGTAAVAENIECSLTKYGTVERLKGKSRYETSLVVANKFFQAPSAAVLAYSQNFPDGLCGGPLAAEMNAPLLLTATDSAAYAELYAKDSGINSGAVLGGTKLISDEAVRKIFSMSAGAKIEETEY